jgi:hypothetical protein
MGSLGDESRYFERLIDEFLKNAAAGIEISSEKN